MTTDQKPKVLIFSTAYLPLVGGAEIALKEITDRLPDYDFDLITARLDRKLPKQEKIGRVMVYRLGWGLKSDKIYLALFGHIFAYKLHKAKAYDLIWGMMASFASLSAVKFKKQTNLPLLVSLQEGDDLKKIEVKAKILGLWWFKIFTEADQIQAISTYLADWAYQLGFKGKVKIIPNGVDLDLFKFHNQAIDWSDKSREIKLMTTSRLVFKNGLDLVISALPYLPATISFHIAGLGREKQKLEALAKKLKVNKRVIFHNLIPYAQLPDFLLRGEAFIRLSRTEGLGNSFLEAMASGLPVFGTEAGGLADFLNDQETGFVVKSTEPKIIAQTILKVLNDNNEAKLTNLRLRARGMIEEKYSWSIVSSQMDLLIKNLL